MELGLGNTLLPGDPRLIDHIVGEVKSQGIFDQFRKDALADVDTKPAYQNLRTRVEGSVNSFLSKQVWKADLNKNQLRETLRKHISDGAYLDAGVERIVDQVVNPKIYSIFMPQIEDVVYKYLGIEKPKREKNGSCDIKDLLPIDLDPVSPESDKNSLKDVSLDSVDTDLLSTGNKSEKLQFEEHTKNSDTEISEAVNINIVNNEINEKPADEKENKVISHSTPTIDCNLLNDSARSDDKTEEEEEDSPVFEPIDIMNFNESNVSNDSHLSGISELTSHRSRSPDFGNEFSRDNFDFSNQDSQFSKVSSDSRLSIVTDFGSSNPASTPVSDTPKEDSKNKLSKDNIKMPTDDTDRAKEKEAKINDTNKVKDVSDSKDSLDTKSLKSNASSKEVSHDSTDSEYKDKNEHKIRELSRDSSKSKLSKEHSDSRDSRSHRNKSHNRKSSLSDYKSDYSDKLKVGDKEYKSEPNDKSKEKETDIAVKTKEEKSKDTSVKEQKDLKDIYKEKIRELREKKELTEKEKLNKDNKDSKTPKDTKDKKHSSRDKKDERNLTSKSHSSRHESKSKSSSRDESKSDRSNSKDKSKKDERQHSKDNKGKLESTDKKRSSKADKDEKSDKRSESRSNQKSSKDPKKESKTDSYSKSSGKSDNKRDLDSKEKKRRDEKKSKTKDDHGSLRKSTRDRRSSDRDGSSGSNSKGSKSCSSPNSSSAKPASSNLNKESSNTSNSNSETSDGASESQVDENQQLDNNTTEKTSNKIINNEEGYSDIGGNLKRIDLGHNEISLPLKKRPLQAETVDSEIAIKKFKLNEDSENIKKLINSLKNPGEQKSKRNIGDKKITGSNENVLLPSTFNAKDNKCSNVPDDERVQIIEVKDEEEDEPYPEDIKNYTLQQPSSVILEKESLLNSLKSKLSDMELSIRESLNDMMSDKKLDIEVMKTDQENTSEDLNTGANKTKKYIVDNSCKTGLNKNTKYRKKHEQKSPVVNSSKYLRQSNLTKNNTIKINRYSDDEEDCLYFLQDNDRLNRFNKFLKSLEQDEKSTDVEVKIILNHESKSSEFNTMAPPVLKRKYSSSPLSDILLNNSNNNNEARHTNKINAAMSDEEGVPKKKRVGRPKKQRPSVSSSSPQSVTNGENFVMPLSPDSDVSATSEKISLNNFKDDKSRQRSNQRYTSDDLYKPRPLFVGSSRRNRRSDQT